MVSGFIGNEVPRKGLRVRVPCPPPFHHGVCEISQALFDAPSFCPRRHGGFVREDTNGGPHSTHRPTSFLT